MKQVEIKILKTPTQCDGKKWIFQSISSNVKVCSLMTKYYEHTNASRLTTTKTRARIQNTNTQKKPILITVGHPINVIIQL